MGYTKRKCDNCDKEYYEPASPAVFSADEMVSFGNFIRDNYHGVGAPKLQSYNPVKYPHGTIDDIFVYWCLENDR